MRTTKTSELGNLASVFYDEALSFDGGCDHKNI